MWPLGRRAAEPSIAPEGCGLAVLRGWAVEAPCWQGASRHLHAVGPLAGKQPIGLPSDPQHGFGGRRLKLHMVAQGCLRAAASVVTGCSANGAISLPGRWRGGQTHPQISRTGSGLLRQTESPEGRPMAVCRRVMEGECPRQEIMAISGRRSTAAFGGHTTASSRRNCASQGMRKPERKEP